MIDRAFPWILFGGAIVLLVVAVYVGIQPGPSGVVVKKFHEQPRSTLEYGPVITPNGIRFGLHPGHSPGRYVLTLERDQRRRNVFVSFKTWERAQVGEYFGAEE